MNKNCDCMRGFARNNRCTVCNAPWQTTTDTSPKPFDLAEALRGKPVVCRNGERVSDIAELKDTATFYALVGKIGTQKHNEQWLKSGRFASNIWKHSYDLFMVGLLDGSEE